MCMLIKKTSCLKKGMYVYVVRYIYHKQICSPFRASFTWKLKKTYTVPEGNIKIKRRFLNRAIDSGVFHSFYSEASAKKMLTRMDKDNRHGVFTIHKAWIPAGTYIAEGSIGMGSVGEGMQCLGSRKLMLSKEVDRHIIKRRMPEVCWPSSYYRTSSQTTYSTSTATGYVYNTGSTT